MPTALSSRQQPSTTGDDDTSHTKWWIIAVAAGVVVLFVAAITLCICLRRRRRARPQSHKPSFEPFAHSSIPMLHNSQNTQNQQPPRPNFSTNTGYSAHLEQSDGLLSHAAEPGVNNPFSDAHAVGASKPSRPNSTISVPPATIGGGQGHGHGHGFLQNLHLPSFHQHGQTEHGAPQGANNVGGVQPPAKVGEAANYYSMTEQGLERGLERRSSVDGSMWGAARSLDDGSVSRERSREV